MEFTRDIIYGSIIIFDPLGPTDYLENLLHEVKKMDETKLKKNMENWFEKYLENNISWYIINQSDRTKAIIEMNLDYKNLIDDLFSEVLETAIQEIKDEAYEDGMNSKE